MPGLLPCPWGGVSALRAPVSPELPYLCIIKLQDRKQECTCSHSALVHEAGIMPSSHSNPNSCSMGADGHGHPSDQEVWALLSPPQHRAGQ